MSKLDIADDTYRGFFSKDFCDLICRTWKQASVFRSLADSIILIITDEVKAMFARREIHKKEIEDNYEKQVLLESVEIEILARNLEMIISEFQNSEETRSEILRIFPEFEAKRINSIYSLRSVARKINSDRFNCNVSKQVASSAGIIGGVMGVGGSIAAVLATGGLALPIVIGGAGLGIGALGAATNVGTSITETVLLKQDITRAKEVIAEDERMFSEMSKWFTHSHDVKTAMMRVMDIDLMKEAVKDFGTVLISALNFKYRMQELDGKIRELVKLILMDKTFPNLNFCINTAALIVGFLVAMACIQNENRIVFDSGMMFLKLAVSVARLLDVGVDSAMAISSAVRAGGMAVSRAAGQAAAHTALGVISVSLDIANIVLTSIDMQKGSVSSHATQFKELADKLEEELMLIQNVYEECLLLYGHVVID